MKLSRLVRAPQPNTPATAPQMKPAASKLAVKLPTSSSVSEVVGSPPKPDDPGACPICSSAAIGQVNRLPFYSSLGERLTGVLFCRDCGLFWRRFQDPAFPLEKHYEMASYTNLLEEENWRRARAPFFLQLLARLQDYQPSRPGSLLDYGCSYGHLMDLAAERGYTCAGVELVRELRERLRLRYKMYRMLEEVDERFEAITSIDSLYYSPNPAQAMEQMARLLKEQGVLVVRIANRAPLLRLLLFLRGSFTNHHMGDQLFVLNDKAMRLLARRAGLAVRQVLLRERKPLWDSCAHFLGYGLLPLVCRLAAVKWTPGLTYILQKSTAELGIA